MTDHNIMIVWDEPYEGEFGTENRRCQISPEEAIRRQRAAVTKARGVDVYDPGSDGDRLALEDFRLIHWAWEEIT